MEQISIQQGIFAQSLQSELHFNIGKSLLLLQA